MTIGRQLFCKSTAHFYPEQDPSCKLMPEAKSGMLQASAISHLVGAANSKLAAFIRAQEDEEARLISKVKTRQLFKTDGDPRRRLPRFAAPAQFSRPSPIVERGRLSGAAPFHMAVTTVSRRVADISVSRFERPDRSATPAFDHAEYVERDGAAEVIESAQEGYIARPGAIERIVSVAGLGEFERAEPWHPGSMSTFQCGPARVRAEHSFGS